MGVESADLGTCHVCGKVSYPSRRAAKKTARRLFPGDRMRAYKAHGNWHFGHVDPAKRRSRKTPERTRRIEAEQKGRHPERPF